MLGAQGGIRGKPSRKICVCSCILVNTGAVQQGKREGREGVSPGEERLEVAQVDGKEWCQCGYLLSHLLCLQYNTFIPRVAVSSAGVGESRETQSHGQLRFSHTCLPSPGEGDWLDHLAPGYHLGLLSQGTMEAVRPSPAP